MTLRTGVIVYLIALAVFFVIDMGWLGWLSGNLYKNNIGHLLGPVNWIAAIFFYLIFVAGIVYFSVLPGLNANSCRPAALRGALYGLFTYATYDLTNMATLQGWPWKLVFIDVAWGTVLSASVGTITCLIALRLPGNPGVAVR